MTTNELREEIDRLQRSLAKLGPGEHHQLLGPTIKALRSLNAALLAPAIRHLTIHDGEVHDPLGAGSYMFQRAVIPSVLLSAGLPLQETGTQLPPQDIIVHIGAQPNNSPHAGTLVVFFMGFLVAREIKAYYETLRRSDHGVSKNFGDWIDDLRVVVHLDLVDTAPDNSGSPELKGSQIHHAYQRSLRSTQGIRRFEADYDEIPALASKGLSIPYKITRQADLARSPSFPRVIERVVKHRDTLAQLLAPEKGVLAMRAACPHDGCGLADKHGLGNEYHQADGGAFTISFVCPLHGRHSISTSNTEDVSKLEFNTPLRNLVRSLAFAHDTVESRKEVEEGKEGARRRAHVRVTGSDYAGFYYDQMFWRPWVSCLGLEKEKDGLIHNAPAVLFAPLIVDWAGSKLSKSLYVKQGAYEYMKDLGIHYLLSFEDMKKMGKDPLFLLRLVESWMMEPKKLFRSFSVDYLHLKYRQAEEA